ncbi:helix-turn-helix domain-containing protein [Parafilimonas sp.]|uniref:helix-turn-helix domain-containing protein n=1 Tax=Parafilimonas sp. TaxID=1969739 RepID=UPI0039E5F2BD
MLGQKIKLLREYRNFTQQYMADELGISQNAYSKIELNKSKLNVNIAEHIANILQISLADLLNKNDPVISFNESNLDKSFDHKQLEIQKSFYEKRISILEAELDTLKKREEQLLRLIEKLSS